VSNLVDHARRELELCQEDPDYAESIVRAVEAFASYDGHSGGSMLRRHQLTPAWHHHLIDVENLAVGYLAAQLQAAESTPPSGARAELGDLLTPPWQIQRPLTLLRRRATVRTGPAHPLSATRSGPCGSTTPSPARPRSNARPPR
jgi:hypothetical protein